MNVRFIVERLALWRAVDPARAVPRRRLARMLAEKIRREQGYTASRALVWRAFQGARTARLIEVVQGRDGPALYLTERGRDEACKLLGAGIVKVWE